MGYTQREFASNADSISSYDSQTLGPSSYSAAATLGCNDQMLAVLTAIKGITGFVQSASSASGLGSYSSTSLAFGSNNATGNCIVVDVEFDATFPLVTAVCTDSQGNTYSEVFFGHVPGSGQFTGTFVAFGITAGANTVTVTFSGSGVPGNAATIAIHEYTGSSMALDSYGINYISGAGTVNVSVTAAAAGDWLHLAIGIGRACMGSPSNVTGGIVEDWLVVNEPLTGSPATGGLTRRGSFLFADGSKHSFVTRLRERGTANYTLVSDPNDPLSAPTTYEPTMGQPIYLFDENASGYTLEFSGLIQDFTIRWVGIAGLRYIDCTAVSLESVFDTVYAQPMQFVNQTCGAILTALFNAFENGCPVSLGLVQDGPSINLFNAQLGDKLSDLFDQLATTALFTWGVNPQTQQLYFCLPTAVSAPFTIESPNVLWDTISQKFDNADYRNRQAVKLSYDAFPHSQENFVGSGQLSFTLMRPVEQVVNAWVTTSTCNTATASFSGQPSPGDTITIGPANGTWQASNIYGLGGIIVSGGYVYKVTVAGTSGGTIPDFASVPVLGDTIQDNTAIWTNSGPTGLGTGFGTYTFETTLDNTQYGEILIGATLAETVQNTVDALNAAAPYGGTPATNGKGLTLSLPTWENSQVNAIDATGTGFTVQQKAPGSGWIAQLSSSGSAFAWSGANTSGGTSPQTAVGPNEAATIDIAVYVSGTATSAPCLVYTPGSADVSLATPLVSGTNLSVEYTRTDGDVIEVEDTALVNALALISHGTGKYQQSTDQSSQGLISTSAAAGLQFAQEILATFDITQQKFSLDFYRPGILPGQVLTLALNSPLDVMNGSYLVLSIKAQMVYKWPWLDSPQVPYGGHYRYTAELINVNLIGTDLAFWLGLGGGSSGGGSGSAGALVATSGGAGPSTVTPAVQIGGVNEQTGDYSAVEADSGKLIVFNDASPCTLTLPASPPFPQWNIFVENIGAGLLTISGDGLDIDGAASNFTLITNKGIYLTTDGTNYFTERGLEPLATTSIPGIVQPDGVTIDVSAGVISVPVMVGDSGSGGTKGLVPAPTAGSAAAGKFLKADGTFAVPSGTGISNPMTTEGDIIVGGTSGTPARLGLPVATNQIRGTGMIVPSGSSATVTISFPAGTVSGDFAVVFCACSYNPSSYPSGWTSINQISGNGFAMTKTLGSGDISTGSVSITLNSASTICASVITFIGVPGTIRTNSDDAPFGGGPFTLDAAAVAGDTAIYFGAQIPGGASTISINKGTILQSDVGTGQAGILAGFSVISTGTDQVSWNWTGGNSGTQFLVTLIFEPNSGGPINGQVLTVNTSAPDLLAWETPSAGAGTVTAVTGSGAISSSGGATPNITVATATSGALGVVQPDGTIITVSAGVITVPKASSSGFGVVEVDGTTITASAGVISSAGLTNPMTTQGDIIYGGASGVATRLPAGTSGDVLQTNGSGAAPTWVSPSGGGGGALTQIAQQLLGSPAASVTFSSIPGSYTNLLLVIMGASSRSALTDGVECAINADSIEAHYAENYFFNSGSGTQSNNIIGSIPAATAPSNACGVIQVTFASYAGTTFLKTFLTTNFAMNASSTFSAAPETGMQCGSWNSNAAITSLVLTSQAGANFLAGSTFTLYGLT